MRNLGKFLWLLTFTTVIGFILTACNEITDNLITSSGSGETNSNKILKINGLPGNGNFTAYVFNSSTNLSIYTSLINVYNSDGYLALGIFSSGNNFHMYGWNGVAQTSEWTGTGSMPVLIINSNGSTTDTKNPMYRVTTVNFINGNAEIHFNTFTVVVQSELTDISVTNEPEKINYITGETLDLSGLVITATYKDGSSNAVTGYTTNPVDGTILDNADSISVQVIYTENDVTRTTSFNVSVNINPGTAVITFTAEQIVDNVQIYNNITLSRSNTGYPAIYTVSINKADYDTDSIMWEVTGVGIYSDQTVISSESFFKLDTSDVRYNTLGGHLLKLTVMKNGFTFQRAILFTIVQ